MTAHYYDDDIRGSSEERNWEDEHDYKIIWGCPRCGWSYEAYPGYDEANMCLNCNIQTVESGETYIP